MENITRLAQIIVSASVLFVWIFRFHNVIKDFQQFELSDSARNFTGASKISLATLLIIGIWYPSLIHYPAIIMGLFMIGAQYFHFKNNNNFIKRLPSLILLILCSFITYSSI